MDVSDTNVRIFTDTPHADMSTEECVQRIKDSVPHMFARTRSIADIDWRGKVVVDAGCGAGLKGLQFAVKGAKVIGVYGSPTQILRARNNAFELGVDAIFVEERLENLVSAWRENEFPKADLIINYANVHHVGSWRDVLEQYSSILNPGGFIVISWGDPTLSLAGFNIKNQIAFRLGWSDKSRYWIGRALFGWWDRRRNVMRIGEESYYADLYSAYYIPIAAGKMVEVLNKIGIDVIESNPPISASHYRLLSKGLLGKFPDAIVRWRYFFRWRHGPRLFVGRKR